MKINFKKLYSCVLVLQFLACFSVYADMLTVTIHNRTNNNPTNIVSFGVITESTNQAESLNIAPQYLKIAYTNDYPDDWLIQINTENNNRPGDYHGGLIGVKDINNRIPLFWQVYTNTNSNITFTTDNQNTWGNIKDKNDIDWLNSMDERFIATNRISGCFPSSNMCAKSPLYLYTGADFYNGVRDTYNTTIYLELLPFSTFAIVPGVNHQPLDEINIIGDKFIIYADLSDEDKIETVTFGYKKKSASLFHNIVYYPGTKFYRLKDVIPPSIITTTGIEYYIEAMDEQKHIFNTQSYSVNVIPHKTKTIGPSGGDIEMIDGNPEDGMMKLSIPSGVLPGNMSITIRQIYDEDDMIAGNGIVNGQMPLAMFELTPALNLNSLAKLTLLYFDLNNNGKVETGEGKETEIDEKKLGILWWDGFEWRYIGGDVNSQNNTVSAYITHFSTFALFSVEGLTKEAFRPKERIATPNGDGINDVIHFGGAPGQLNIVILDINGREIRNITNIPMWDAKDSNGHYVESGVYIYQAELYINGKRELMSGTVAIAK